MKKNKVLYFFFPAFIVLFLILGIIIYPTQSISAAKEGLSIWTNVLIPSLLPFMVGSNLIVDLKVIDIIGYIINPITKFIFNVSGKSALVFAISTVSGYPVGAKLASQLRDNKQISLSESQRLTSFCSTSGPLFIVGAIGIGMFKNPNVGYLMLICHYLGSLSIGILFRNYGNESLTKSQTTLKNNILKTIETRTKSTDGFFILFGNAIFNGINTILVVGGFVIIFSVVFKVLSLFNIISVLSSILYIPLSLFGVNKELCYAFISGLFEITIGCNKISQVSSAPQMLKVALSSFLIAFSGLSILAQCCSFIAKTDINTNIYILCKFLHGILASLFTVLLYPLLESKSLVSNFSNIYEVFYNNSLWNSYIINFKSLTPIFIIMYILSALFILEKISLNIKKES